MTTTRIDLQSHDFELIQTLKDFRHATVSLREAIRENCSPGYIRKLAVARAASEKSMLEKLPGIYVELFEGGACLVIESSDAFDVPASAAHCTDGY